MKSLIFALFFAVTLATLSSNVSACCEVPSVSRYDVHPDIRVTLSKEFFQKNKNTIDWLKPNRKYRVAEIYYDQGNVYPQGLIRIYRSGHASFTGEEASYVVSNASLEPASQRALSGLLTGGGKTESTYYSPVEVDKALQSEFTQALEQKP